MVTDAFSLIFRVSTEQIIPNSHFSSFPQFPQIKWAMLRYRFVTFHALLRLSEQFITSNLAQS